MPSLNFTMFIPAVENGLAELEGRPLPHPGVRPKRQTIRALRKVPIKPGDVLHLFTGMRTKGCHRLGKAKCKSRKAVLIQDRHGTTDVRLSGSPLGLDKAQAFARSDGFASLLDLRRWFERVHGLPFRGVVIRW